MPNPDGSPAYTTVIGCNCGKAFLLDIPAGAVKNSQVTELLSVFFTLTGRCQGVGQSAHSSLIGFAEAPKAINDR